MRYSQFRALMDDEFGVQYARHLASSLNLTEFASRTPDEAIKAGAPLREVWLAVCRSQDVPQERWLGKEPPKKGQERQRQN